MSSSQGIKKFTLGCIIIIIAYFFWQSLNIQEYQDYHILSLDVSGQQEFIVDVSLRRSPLPEKWIVDLIDASHEKVWVAVYTWTLPSLREALVRAHKRGVDVRVILEKFPFGNTTINRETELFLKENNIPLHLSGEKQFAFMHAKFAIIDTNWIIETANWTRASFSSNREFFIQGKDESILKNLSGIFEDDSGGKIGISQDVRLLAGPTNARERLISFLDSTKTHVDIYAPSFSDEGLLAKLLQLCTAKKVVRLLLADYEEIAEKALEKAPCVQIHIMQKPLHAKVLIRDSESAFVGSFNYTKNSLESNRELGIFISGEAVKSISQSFEADWKLSEVALR